MLFILLYQKVSKVSYISSLLSLSIHTNNGDNCISDYLLCILVFSESGLLIEFSTEENEQVVRLGWLIKESYYQIVLLVSVL